MQFEELTQPIKIHGNEPTHCEKRPAGGTLDIRLLYLAVESTNWNIKIIFFEEIRWQISLLFGIWFVIWTDTFVYVQAQTIEKSMEYTLLCLVHCSIEILAVLFI